MQFIEKNSFNVRSAFYHLESKDSEINFVLLPMIHIGSKTYYQQIGEELSKCDLILAEGVSSKKAKFLTLSYRIVKKIKRMDLTTQQESLDIAKFGNKVFNSDINEEDFDEGWASLPITLRVLFILAIPFYILYLFVFGTKEVIAKNIALEDLPDSEDILNSTEDSEKLDKLLIDDRDRILIGHIKTLIDENDCNKKNVSILYGAAHMQNVVDYLMSKKNYRITESKWITVFEL